MDIRYLTGRALYYYFLMREIGEADTRAWKFIADRFGVKKSDIGRYGKILSDPFINQVKTCTDAAFHINYLNRLCRNSSAFGVDAREREVLETMFIAMQKAGELFGDSTIKTGRLRSLSHKYESNHTAAVLYALQVLYNGGGKDFDDFAEGILVRELKDGKNSDAGILLFKCGELGADEVYTELSSTPDMALYPELLETLAKMYGVSDTGDAPIKTRRVIGF